MGRVCLLVCSTVWILAAASSGVRANPGYANQASPEARAGLSLRNNQPSPSHRSGTHPEVLRHLSQRPCQDRRTVARRCQPGGCCRPCRAVGEGRDEAPRRHDAAAGMPRPDAATLDAFATTIERTIDNRALRSPDPGPSIV